MDHQKVPDNVHMELDWRNTKLNNFRKLHVSIGPECRPLLVATA